MYEIYEGLYKKLYLKLFNEVTDAIALIDEGNALTAREKLITAQQDCEEIYISGSD